MKPTDDEINNRHYHFDIRNKRYQHKLVKRISKANQEENRRYKTNVEEKQLINSKK